MKKKEAIKMILKCYNELRTEKKYFERNNMNTDYLDGELSAMRYILIEIYNFKTNDKRF